MNYLLAMPRSLGAIDHFNIFPIGLAYVSASLKRDRRAVHTVNLDYVEGDARAALAHRMRSCDAHVVCTGGLSRDYRKVREVLDVARSVNGKVLTVVGGGIVSADPETAMRALGADVGVIGEGEVTLCALAQALDDGSSYADVAGIIYRRDDGAYVTTAPRGEIANVDGIPFPDFDGFDYARWVEASGSGVLLTDRSCPFRCTFCFHPTGSKYRQRSLDSIFAELDLQIERYHLKSVGLSSELFSVSPQRVVEFCERVRPYRIPWSCCLRVPDVDLALLRLMKAAGCVNLVLGLESADDSVLKSMRKKITVAQIGRALELTYEAELMIEGGFIFGDAKETQATVDNTLSYWRANNDRHYLNLSMISVFPGSALYRQACETGLIADPQQFLRDGCPLVNVSKLSDTEYLGLRSRVTELRLHPHVPAKVVRIDAARPDGTCDVTFTCRNCGVETPVAVSFWFGREVRCRSCSLTNFVDPFQAARHVPERFSAPLRRHDRVALWGAGGIFYKLMDKYEVLASERVVVVDANPANQGLTLRGKLVQAPQILAREHFGAVVIAAMSRKSEILASVRADLPAVGEVFCPSFEVTPEGVVPVLSSA